ncbi:MAG: sensor domain-containing diguanylate cyclase [Eubacterium sp.]|nr:sensor domain-containing diguanylate cyclase [Eubacterium sp.]MCM1215706.1 sensor domain-containing diguanylate cyclase [Lachnospiraceae bacterium]MCM1238270.1 sensor domain-containing diguanylate cyclase [Lachnospiraceae bacterium]
MKVDGLWKFYEEMNELVYAADMDSHELVYMNRKAREICGIDSLEELKERKCHELFYDRDTPCAGCNNAKLKPGRFVEEMRYHPGLKKRFALKQTMLEENGRRYRMELTVDLSAWEKWGREYEANAIMVNEALRVSLSAHTPDRSVSELLAYLGRTLQSERVYIFEESEENSLDNTYEWCADGIVSQKENLQHVPFEVVEPWYRKFGEGENVLIKDVESIREREPAIYEYLEPQNIRSIIVSPLVNEGKIIGFYGVDNPPGRFLGTITALFQILGHFMVSLIHRRNHVRKLEAVCFQDPLTGLSNRHAMNQYIAALQKEKSIGVLFCDVTGLKKANDAFGHREGDKLLMRASECLKSGFSDYALFRVGGDEFLVLCAGIREEELQKRKETVKGEMGKWKVNMAIGSVWRPDNRENLDKLITEADDLMYEDKRAWYAKMGEQHMR